MGGVLALTAGAALGISQGPFKENPTHIYTLNSDEKSKSNEYKDLVTGSSKKPSKLYIKDSEGKFSNIKSLRKKELESLENWHDKESVKIEDHFKGLRKKLKEDN